MNPADNTVLITGGASGIGLALAQRFLKAGSRVIICGRRQEKLREAAAVSPGLITRVCDVGSEADRVALAEWVVREYPALNVLVNNAGIQRRGVDLSNAERWPDTHSEIAINLEAPIHLTGLLTPHLRRQANAAILNVTSGLSFVPIAYMPVYCATKAALHSITLSLRRQLTNTPVKVIEIIPPAVNTDLGGPGLHTFGVPLDEFADAVMQRVATGELEIAYGFAEQASKASRAELDEHFERLNQPRG
ncbi:MAG TPA: SDR family oxidoreductase [Candidatus Limnocylindrales bacterium]|jgi:uncharacterized oxidoreductase|nr:SDR family oxidoreductase [Candidatus Limnocylindrales bacterium]